MLYLLFLFLRSCYCAYKKKNCFPVKKATIYFENAKIGYLVVEGLHFLICVTFCNKISDFKSEATS